MSRRLMQFLAAARERLPEWQTEVTHLITPEQLRRLRAGELDLGIFHYAGEQEGLELVRVFTGEPLVAYLAPDDPLAAEPVITPELVAGHTLVLFARETNPTLHDWLLALLADAGFHFRAVRAASGVDILRDLLVAGGTGAGINIAPFSIREVSQAGDIVVRRPIEPPLAAPDTVVAIPAAPPRRLADVVAGVRDIAAGLLTGEAGAGLGASS
jgi:DNA-binding transcriptional LysR family regulator